MTVPRSLAFFHRVNMKAASYLAAVLLLVVLAPTAALGQQSEEKLHVKAPPLRIGNEVYVPQGRMRLGPFSLHPYAGVRYGSDSNVYYLEDDPVSSSVMVTEAGARFDLLHKRQLFVTDYRFRYNSYSDKDARDNSEHEAELLGEFRIRSFFVNMKGDYANLFEPTPVYYNTKARREEFKGSFDTGFDSHKLYVEAGYEARSYHFEGKNYDRASNKQNAVSGELGYKFSKKTQVRLRFVSGSVDYSYDKPGWQNDYTYTSVFLGVRHKAAGKVITYLYLGSTSQSVDNTSNNQDEEFSGVTAFGSLAYQVSRKTVLNANLLREIQYNAYANYLLVTKVELIARYQWTQKIMVSVRVGFEDSEPSEEIGMATSATRTTVGASVRYDLTRWLSAGLGGKFQSKSAKLDLRSYSNNKLYAFLTMYF